MNEAIGKSRWVRVGILILLGLVAAWSWLFVVSKWGPANRIDILTFKAGLTSKIMRTLVRDGRAMDGGTHDHASDMISGIYATPEYFAMTEQNEKAARYLPERYPVFYVFEDIHVGSLSPSPPVVTLRLDDGRELSTIDYEVIRDSPHHRATVVRFPEVDADGRRTLTARTHSLELWAAGWCSAGSLVSQQQGSYSLQMMHWDLPIVYPQDLKEGSESLGSLFALLAGLLAVLSPCLLQLTVYYTFALAGISMHQDPSNLAGARGQVIRTALFFTAGFTIVFTLSGALAGLAGQTLQSSGIMEAWNRPLMIAAGIGLMLLGVWVGSNSGAPGLCRLPVLSKLGQGNPWVDRLKMMFMGSAFAVGCSTCFGGALFISLMIYVGSVGSAYTGALTLFLFSLGITVPYLLSAFFLSRALPLLGSLQKTASVVGLVSSVVLVFFGVILITDNFHVPSSLLYGLYLGL